MHHCTCKYLFNRLSNHDFDFSFKAVIQAEYGNMAKIVACAEHFATNNDIPRNEAVSTLLSYMYVWLASTFPHPTAHRGHRSCIALSFCWCAVGWGIRDWKFRGEDARNRRNPFNLEQYLSHVADKKAMEWLGEPGNQGYMRDLRLLDYLFSMLRTQSMVVGFLYSHPETAAALPESGA